MIKIPGWAFGDRSFFFLCYNLVQLQFCLQVAKAKNWAVSDGPSVFLSSLTPVLGALVGSLQLSLLSFFPGSSPFSSLRLGLEEKLSPGWAKPVMVFSIPLPALGVGIGL